MDVYGAFPGLGQYHNPKIYGKAICTSYMLDFPRLPSVGIPNGGLWLLSSLFYYRSGILSPRAVCAARQDCCYMKQTMESCTGEGAGF